MKLTLNLASRKYINERVVKLGCLLACLFLIVLLAIQFSTFLQSREENLILQNEIDQLEIRMNGKTPKRFTEQQIAVQRADFQLAKTMLRKDAFRWTALFDRMERLLPGDVSIRSFRPNYKQGSLIITGVAKDLGDLQELLDRLHADSFKQVFLTSQDQIEVFDYQEQKQPALSFSIQLEGVF